MDLIPTMIVEDEKILLNALLTVVDWEAAGFQIVATAINGKQGVKKFEEYHPQLIITDIKMPVMDGIAMMKSIKYFSPATEFIVVSAYGDFEYAQDALRLGAVDYILKTHISSEYLSEKLQNFKNYYQKDRSLKLSAFKQMLEELIHSDLNLSTEEFHKSFGDLFVGQKLQPYYDAACKIFESAIALQKLDITLSPATFSSGIDLEAWLFKQQQTIRNTNKLYLEKKLSPAVITAYNYIKENYSDPNLKISVVADHVGLSESRLSVLFKSETGQTVNDFLTEIRIEEAKYLLKWKKLMVYEVSELVGYKTSQYFSKVFYKYTGQYPNSYRDPGSQD